MDCRHFVICRINNYCLRAPFLIIISSSSRTLHHSHIHTFTFTLINTFTEIHSHVIHAIILPYKFHTNCIFNQIFISVYFISSNAVTNARLITSIPCLEPRFYIRTTSDVWASVNEFIRLHATSTLITRSTCHQVLAIHLHQELHSSIITVSTIRQRE